MSKALTSNVWTILSKDSLNYVQREWCIKILQNVSLVLHGQTRKINPDFSKRMLNLNKSVGDARCSYAVFKIFYDIAVLKSLKNPTLLQYGDLYSHITFVFFQNVQLYMKKKATKKDYSPIFIKLFNFFWLVNIGFVVAQKKKQLDEYKTTGDAQKDEQKKKILKIQIFSQLCDVFASCGGSGIPELLTGRNFPAVLRGATGALAASTSLYAYKLNQKI